MQGIVFVFSDSRDCRSHAVRMYGLRRARDRDANSARSDCNPVCPPASACTASSASPATPPYSWIPAVASAVRAPPPMPPANQRVNTVFRQETCQCTVTAAVGRNNSRALHRAVLYIVNLKCFRVSEVLKNLSVFIRYCDSHCLSPFLRQYCLCLLPCSARASPAAAIFLTQLIRPARNAQSIITHSCRSVKQLAVPNPQQKRWQP